MAPEQDDTIDLRTGASDGDGAPRADYSAWRERMRSKSQRNRTLFSEAEAEAEPAPRSTYWDAESLFRDSDVVEAADTDHLAVLDLREGATQGEILRAYRNLAKLHHPDRYAEADAETRQYHDDCMRAINEAYAALRNSHQA
jgi:DnaJ-domain-containing protein 1